MKILINLVGALILFMGLGCLCYAAAIPTVLYQLGSASAVQATQVYTMGVFWAGIAVGLLLIALICVVGANSIKST